MTPYPVLSSVPSVGDTLPFTTTYTIGSLETYDISVIFADSSTVDGTVVFVDDVLDASNNIVTGLTWTIFVLSISLMEPIVVVLKVTLPDGTIVYTTGYLVLWPDGTTTFIMTTDWISTQPSPESVSFPDRRAIDRTPWSFPNREIDSGPDWTPDGTTVPLPKKIPAVVTPNT